MANVSNTEDIRRRMNMNTSTGKGEVILKLLDNFKVSHTSHVAFSQAPGGKKMSMEDVDEVQFGPALAALLKLGFENGTLPIKDGQIAALVLVIADHK